MALGGGADQLLPGGPSWMRLVFALVVLARISGLLLKVLEPVENEAFQSIFVRSSHTLEHLREAVAIRSLRNDTFADYYADRQYIQLPPLILGITTQLVHLNFADRILPALALLVDIAVAVLLWNLGHSVMFIKSPIVLNEEATYSAMPEAISPPTDNPFPTIWILSDSNSNDQPRKIAAEHLPGVASLLYLASPAPIISGDMYSCFQNTTTLLLLVSIYNAFRGGPSTISFVALSFAVYMDLHCCVYIVPIWFIFSSYSDRSLPISLPIGFVLSTLTFHVVSAYLVGTARYKVAFHSVYGIVWDNLAPNLSVLWYLRMQLFQRFADYFELTLLVLPYTLVGPLAIRLKNYPLELVTILWLLFAIFRPNPTLVDLNFAASLMLLCPRSVARMGLFSVVALCSIPVTLVLYVVDSWMWLQTGSGNANYIFFQCLAYNAFVGILLANFCGATLRRDKAIRLTRKVQAAQGER